MLTGAAYVNAHREEPGVIRRSGGQQLVFGELNGADTPRTARLCEVFQQAGIIAEARTDIKLAIWEKFAGISAAGAQAVVRLPLGPVLACPETREFVRQTIAEAVAVGRAYGVMLPDNYAERFIAMITPFPAWTKPSMLVDLEAGRRLELEAINGTVVRLAV